MPGRTKEVRAVEVGSGRKPWSGWRIVTGRSPKKPDAHAPVAVPALGETLPERPAVATGPIIVEPPLQPERVSDAQAITIQEAVVESRPAYSDVQMQTAREWLSHRAQRLHKQVGEDEIGQQAIQLLDMCAPLTPAEREKLLTDDYVVQSLEYFFKIKPERIKLALGVSETISNLAASVDQTAQQERGDKLDRQFLPSMQIAAYVAVEQLANMGLQEASAQEAERQIRCYAEQSELSREQASVLRHLTNYLAQLDPEVAGTDMQTALVQTIGMDVYRKLARITEENAWLGQSQGMEIEVLRYKGSFDELTEAEKRRGPDPKWLPRAVPMEAHQRTDWQLLPLLGISEDVGERDFQEYEMAADPTETGAAQAFLIHQLIQGGFVSEHLLSDPTGPVSRRGKEAFSLHVSTVFPHDIIKNDSLAEYRIMARTLAGAFASDQRIGYGGFMSGGTEVENKTAAGTLKETGVRKDRRGRAPKGLALVEIRNLDVTLRGQYPAIHAKEVLDFAFRSAWVKRLRPREQQTAEEEFGAARWTVFMEQVQQLFEQHGMSSKQLLKRYGRKWEQQAWKHLAQTREEHPEFRDQLARLIRECVTDIKGYHREAVKQRLSQAESYENGEVGVNVGKVFLTAEPLTKLSRGLFLSNDMREALGLEVGDSITLQYGRKKVQVKVERGRTRGDGKVEGLDDPYLRVSRAVLDKLGVPNGFAIDPILHREDGRLILGRPELESSPVVVIRQPRKILAETHGRQQDNKIYVSLKDRQRLGVQVGEKITVRFGHKTVVVEIAQAKRKSLKAGPSWRLSKNVVTELHMPDNLRLRAHFDKTTGEFVFGPTIAQTQRIVRENADGTITMLGNVFAKQSVRQAREYGAFMCVVDLNKQRPEVLEQGLIDALILDRGTWKKVQVPIPDVLYDKDVSRRNATARSAYAMFERQVVSVKTQTLTKDKWKFATMFQESSLAPYHPDTRLLASEADLEASLERHDNLILKPRFGQQGRHMASVKKNEDSSLTVRFTLEDEERNRYAQEVQFATVHDAYEALAKYKETASFGGSDDFIIQERLPLARIIAKGITADERESDGTLTPGHEVEYEATPEARIVIQRGIDGQPRITGMFMRLLNPNFGSDELQGDPNVVLEALFHERKEAVMKQMRDLALRAHRLMERESHGTTGEVTFDMGILQDGQLCIIEANSKAETRKMFADRNVHNEDAALQSTSRPIEYAMYMTDMD